MNNTLTFFSERWPQAALLPRVDDCAPSEVNAIFSSFGADVAQLRDMELKTLFSIHPPDLKVVLRTGPKGTVKPAFTYLPKPRQKHIPF